MAAQHDMSADIKLAEQNASSITLGIDGAPHDLQKLTAMLRKRGMTKNVVGCKLVHELAQHLCQFSRVVRRAVDAERDARRVLLG